MLKSVDLVGTFTCLLCITRLHTVAMILPADEKVSLSLRPSVEY